MIGGHSLNILADDLGDQLSFLYIGLGVVVIISTISLTYELHDIIKE